ncbi:MAG TPA: hypothetical protein VEO54_19440 [Thermoanaerobaculia bacterium]|nr:hypothetical protein [Thermoanaerobaculia bacterium]
MSRPLLLLLALLAAHFAYVLRHFEHVLQTDELYYAGKARAIVARGGLVRADPQAIAVERGEAWGTSDWRPQGYPLLLAAVSLGDFEHPAHTLRLRMTILQFLLVAAVLVHAFLLSPRTWPSALILGLPPWTFGFVNELGPDSVNVAVVWIALLLLWRYVQQPSAGRMFAAALVFSLALFIRPEMIAMPPLMVGVALLMRFRRTPFGTLVRHALVAAAAWSALVGVQAAYHTWATGQRGIFGGLHITNAGAFAWANNWWGTEKETYDFVYALTEAREMQLPERAFDTAEERAEVMRVIARVRQRGSFTAEDDAVFARLAAEKKRAHPIRSVVLRGWHAWNMWFNTEHNNPLLIAMAPVPRMLRLPVWGALLLLRWAILALAMVAFVRALRQRDPLSLLIVLLIAYALLRTAFVGGVLNWNVHRYILSAWPPVLFSACMFWRRRA